MAVSEWVTPAQKCPVSSATGVLRPYRGLSASWERNTRAVVASPGRPERSNQATSAESPFGAHHVEYENPRAIKSVEHPARRLHDLAIPPTFQLLGSGPALGVVSQLRHVLENAAHQLFRGCLILKRDEVCNRIEIGESGFRPDYFNHLDIRALA